MLLQQPSERLRAVIHLSLILMLAFGLAQLTWRLLPSESIEAPKPLPIQQRQAASSAGDAGLVSQLSRWHLFGKYETKAALIIDEPIPEELPETKLRLTLRGVIASSDPTQARAIVEDAAKNENFYKIGDKLPGNAILTEIYGDRITIKRGNNFETLKLPKESLNLGVIDTPQSLSRNGRRARTSAPQRSAADGSYSLKEYRDTLLSDPRKVSDLVRLTQANKNGKFVGYTLNPGRDPRFLSRYGLQPGDVVTEINGVVLDGPTKGFALMKDLQTTETLDLVIDRNGVKQRFTLPVN